MTPLETTPFFSGNSTFVEELYERYLQNPGSVDESWRGFFKDVTNGAAKPAERAASWAAVKSQVIGVQEAPSPQPSPVKDGRGGSKAAGDDIEKFAHDSIRAIMMVRAYRVRGHL